MRVSSRQATDSEMEAYSSVSLQIFQLRLQISGKMKMSARKRFSSMSSEARLRKRSLYFRRDWLA
jgi:hypothetical protein